MKLCLIGHGIDYTLSPALHAAIMRELGESGEYTAEDIRPEDFDRELARVLDCYDGFNITRPYKERAAEALGTARPINTVRSEDRAATNTDAAGFLRDYTAAFGEPRGRILILGAGGAAKSVAEALSGKAEICVYNRTAERARELSSYGAVALTSLEGEFDAVINCTSLGLCGEQAAPDALDMNKVDYAYDLVYRPRITPFLIKAKESGARVAGGLGMLVWQAIYAHEFWRGEIFDEKARKRLYETGMCAIK